MNGWQQLTWRDREAVREFVNRRSPRPDRIEGAVEGPTILVIVRADRSGHQYRLRSYRWEADEEEEIRAPRNGVALGLDETLSPPLLTYLEPV